MSDATSLTTGFYVDSDNVYSMPKGAGMPYTWAKEIKRVWYDNGERIIYGSKNNPIVIADALAAMDSHIKAHKGRVYYEKKTRSCTVCSYALLAYLLNKKLIGVHKDPFMYYSDGEGNRIYWLVAIHIREKGQAILGNMK